MTLVVRSRLPRPAPGSASSRSAPSSLASSWQVSACPIPGSSQLGYEIEASEIARLRVRARHDRAAVDGDAQVAVPAPGGPLRSREVRHYPRPRAGRLGLVGLERGDCGSRRASSSRRWSARAITLPDDPGAAGQSPSPVLRREFDVAGADRQRPAPRDGPRPAPGLDQRPPVSRRPARAGLDALSATACSADTYDVTRLLTPGRNAIGAVLGTGGTAAASVGTRRTTDAATAGSSGWLPSSRSSCADGTRLVVATDAELAGVDRRDPLGRPVRRRDHRPARGAARLDAPGFDDAAWLRRRRCVPFDPAVIEPRTAPPVRRVRGPAGARASRRGDGRLAARRRPEHLRVRSGSRPGPRGDTVVGAPRRGARAGRRRSTPGRSARRRRPTIRPRRRRRRSCSSRRSRSTASATRRSRRPRERRSTRSSSRSAATRRARARSTCSDARPRPASRERRVVPARQLRLRPDRLPPARRASRLDRRRSGVRADRQHAVRLRGVLDELAARPGARAGRRARRAVGRARRGPRRRARFGRAGWADAATIVPWAVYESYGDPAVLAPAVRRACAAGSPRSSATPRAGRPARAGDAVRRLARPGRPGRPARGRRRPTRATSRTRSSRTAPGSLADAARAARRRDHRGRDRGARRRDRRRDLGPLVRRTR